MNLSKKFLLILLCAPLFLTGCLYKMPTDDDLCTSPNTNNPQLTGEKAPSFFPTQG